jgi:hypothetical protein
MRHARLRYPLILVAALALVLPVTSIADAQSKGTIKIATQSPLSGGRRPWVRASSWEPSWRSRNSRAT